MSGVIKKIDQMAKGSIIGLMEIITKDSFQMGFGMDKGTLNKEKVASSTKDSIKMTKNAGMDRSIMVIN
jgi:hypothetical protein